VKFEWDQSKSASNEAKPGISFAAATALWNGPSFTFPSNQPGEERHLAIGLINGKHWTVIFTQRGGSIRLISARRARKDEKDFFQNHRPKP